MQAEPPESLFEYSVQKAHEARGSEQRAHEARGYRGRL